MSYYPAPIVYQQNQNPLSLFPYRQVKEDSFRLFLLSDPPGLVEIPALRRTIVSIHVGPSAQVLCRRGGQSHRGTAVHGDIDIIPAEMPASWELKDRDMALVLSLSSDLLNLVAEEIGL